MPSLQSQYTLVVVREAAKPTPNRDYEIHIHGANAEQGASGMYEGSSSNIPKGRERITSTQSKEARSGTKQGVQRSALNRLRRHVEHDTSADYRNLGYSCHAYEAERASWKVELGSPHEAQYR